MRRGFPVTFAGSMRPKQTGRSDRFHLVLEPGLPFPEPLGCGRRVRHSGPGADTSDAVQCVDQPHLMAAQIRRRTESEVDAD